MESKDVEKIKKIVRKIEDLEVEIFILEVRIKACNKGDEEYEDFRKELKNMKAKLKRLEEKL